MIVSRQRSSHDIQRSDQQQPPLSRATVAMHIVQYIHIQTNYVSWCCPLVSRVTPIACSAYMYIHINESYECDNTYCVKYNMIFKPIFDDKEKMFLYGFSLNLAHITFLLEILFRKKSTYHFLFNLINTMRQKFLIEIKIDFCKVASTSQSHLHISICWLFHIVNEGEFHSDLLGRS